MIHSYQNNKTTEKGGVGRLMVRFPAAMLAVLATMAALAITFATPMAVLAQDAPAVDEATPAGGKAVGPVDPSNGFPFWYQDQNNLRLDLCLDPNEATSKCLVPFELPAERPADLPDGIRFPDYFPGEAFWWTGEAAMTMTNGSDALLVMAQEAAFANEEPREGDQATFGRIRIRIDGLETGQTYRVTHPYGVDEFVADPIVDGSDQGEINSTEDIGCALPTANSPCQFGENGHVDESLASRIGPFLTWDTYGTDSPDAPPAGYVGDPAVDHAVTGSPNGTNFFKVERLNDDGSVAEELGQTDQFAVSGKVATPQVNAAPYREVFNSARDITLVPSDSSYDVYYTDDGSDPSDPANANRKAYNGPINLDANAGETNKTTFRFVAVDPATGNSSPVMEKTYTIDRQGPSLGADPAGGTYDVPQNVKLSTEDAADGIYYTTDGSNPAVDENGEPTGTTQRYADAIEVARSQTIKAIAVDDLGNKSQIETYRYTIASLAETGPINPQGGYPFWYRDANGVQLDLCLDPQDQKCLQPFEMPDPTATEVSFPDNFPGESFWWTGEADLGLPGSRKSLLVMAQEAAFANENPVDGDQMSFGRVRIRIDGLQIGTKYRVSHPYGTDTFTAEDDGKGGGEINVTEDIGCFPSPGAPCDFDAARFGRVGPFLTWDNFGQGTDANGNPIVPELAGPNGEADAYVGDPNGETGHQVKGSPVTDENGQPQNYFKLERLNNDGSVAQEMGRTDQFVISGKVSKLQVGISKEGGSYKTPQDVLLRASDTNATIYYTTDGSEPTTDGPNSFVGEGTVSQVGGATPTTLKFMAVDANGKQSQVYTETYEVDTAAPDAPAVPQLDEASDSGAKGDYITNDTTPTLVGTAEANAKVKILSGSTQVGSATADANGNYSLTTGPLSNGERQLTVVATDRATNESASTAFKVTIDNVVPGRPGANPAPGTYAAGQTVSFTAEANATIHYTTDASAPTAESTQYSDPIALNSSQTFNVIAVDRAGNASREISFAYVVNSPNRPPTISAITPADGSSLRDRTPTITATVRDAETNLAAANISLRLDGNVANFAYNRTSDLLTFTPRQKLAPGRHSVRLVATDARGERTVEAWTFTITR